MNQYGDTITICLSAGFILGATFTGLMVLIFGKDR